jgi:DNA-binding transcriptional regulator YdaS (Cro superfamily)
LYIPANLSLDKGDEDDEGALWVDRGTGGGVRGEELRRKILPPVNMMMKMFCYIKITLVTNPMYISREST